jgi:hypothetical protein
LGGDEAFNAISLCQEFFELIARNFSIRKDIKEDKDGISERLHIKK